MSIARVNTDYLTGAADAIRRKTGSQNPIPLTQFENEIDNIPTATLTTKTITENGVYNASSDNADGYDVVTVGVPEKNTLDDYFANTLEVADISSATSIPNEFFRNKSSLINVIMPNVTSIGNIAFRDCTNLALTSLPSGVTSISCNAFQGCTNLALTSLPSGVTSIGGYAFCACSNLALTSLPSGVTYISGSAFQGCTYLALTSFPSGVTSIGNSAFNGCTGIPYLDFSVFTQIPTVGSNSFSNTSFPFYFRDQQQLDEWAAATNWSTYAGRFQIKPSGVI